MTPRYAGPSRLAVDDIEVEKLVQQFRQGTSYLMQGGITCGAIEDPRKSSKAIDERVIINFRDKNGVIARFRDKNVVIVRFCDKNVECLYIYYGVIEE